MKPEELRARREARGMDDPVNRLREHVTGRIEKGEAEAVVEVTCEWYLLCENPATHYEPHPILGSVPACDRCPRIGE